MTVFDVFLQRFQIVIFYCIFISAYALPPTNQHLTQRETRVGLESIALSRLLSSVNQFHQDGERLLERDKRQAGELEEEMSGEEPVTEAVMEEEEGIKKGPGLGFILGVCTLICLVIYIFGISYKLIKIHKGTYVEEEPIFLKYK